MKIRDWAGLWAVLMAAFVMVGCEGKQADEADSGGEVEKVESPEGGVAEVKDQEAVEGSKSKEAAPVLPRWTRDSAGYAQYLPKDVDLYLELRKLDVFWALVDEWDKDDALKELDLEDLEDAVGEDLGELKAVEKDMRLVMRNLFGEEVFLSTRGLEWALDGYVFYMEELYPEMVAGIVEGIVTGAMFAGGGDAEAEMLDRMMGKIEEYVEGQLNELDGGAAVSFQVGGKVTEGREKVVELIQARLGKIGEEQEELGKVSFERNGVTWVGFEYDWYPVVMEDLENSEGLGEDVDEELSARLIEYFKDLDEAPLVVVCGEVGEYVVMTVGLGESAAETVMERSEALISEKAFDHLEGYPADGIVGVSWMSDGLGKTFHRLGSYGPVWDGMALGVERLEDVSRGPEMAASLRMVAKLTREKEAGKVFDHVGTLVLDDGLHWQTSGGWLSDWVDLESPLKMAAALDTWEKPAFLRAHWREKKGKGTKTLGQFEEMAKVVKLTIEEMGEFSSEFDEEFEEGLDEDEQEELRRERELGASLRNDFLKAMENLWVGYRDYFRESLGEEVALVMDLEGEAPPMFGLDEDVLKEGRIPRVAYVRPVLSREGLGETWDLWRESGTLLFGIVSEWWETPIPFPDTMSADSNELRTHFFAMPFATEDFLPSLSVSDELFVAGTSKALASKIDKAVQAVEGDGVVRSGVLVELEMGQFWDFCEAWGGIIITNWTGVREMTEEDFDLLESPAEPPLTPEEKEAAEAADDDAVTLEDLLGDDADNLGVPEKELEEWEKEVDELIAEEVQEEAAEDFQLSDVPFLKLDEGSDPREILRQVIGVARQWKGVSYRRWVEGEVPRGSASIHWGDPAPASKEGE